METFRFWAFLAVVALLCDTVMLASWGRPAAALCDFIICVKLAVSLWEVDRTHGQES